MNNKPCNRDNKTYTKMRKFIVPHKTHIIFIGNFACLDVFFFFHLFLYGFRTLSTGLFAFNDFFYGFFFIAKAQLQFLFSSMLTTFKLLEKILWKNISVVFTVSSWFVVRGITPDVFFFHSDLV